MDTALDLTGVASFCDDAEILADIRAIFPTSQRLRHVATVSCGQIFSDDSKGKETEKIEKAFAFFQNTLEQNEAGQLQDPEGDVTTEDKIVELFTAIFDAIGFQAFPEIDPQVLIDGDYAIGPLSPGGPPLIVGTLHAGMDDGGGLFAPVTAFIVRIPLFANESDLSLSSESRPCPAEIEASFEEGDSPDCYPLFYDYTVFPESNVDPDVGLQLGQCSVAPVGPEPVIQLLTPEGFLDLGPAPTGIDCTNVGTEATMTGWRSYAWSILEPVAPLLRVTPAFAGQNPPGGRISNFSPVAPADPNSVGEVAPGSISGTVFDNTDQSTIPGATVDLSTTGEVFVGSTTTNSDGNYSFPGLDLDTYVVEASAPGYFSNTSEPVELTEENPDATVNIGLSEIAVD